MNLTDEQMDKLDELLKPVMGFVEEHCGPNTVIMVGPGEAELVEGTCSFSLDKSWGE